MRTIVFILFTSVFLFANESYLEALSYYYDKNSSNDAKAVTILTEAAKEGNADAAFLLAVAYEQGSIAIKSPQEALKWYEKAASLGDIDATMITGWRYYKGKGCDKNLTKAKQWFFKAADQGDKEASGLLILLEEESLF